jgi:hypothetical protein
MQSVSYAIDKFVIAYGCKFSLNILKFKRLCRCCGVSGDKCMLVFGQNQAVCTEK